MKLTIVFEDYRVSAEYANGHFQTWDAYTRTDSETFSGNTVQKSAFEDAVANSGFNMADYWAVQYSGGNHEIEFANGAPHQTVSGNTGLSYFMSALEGWTQQIAVDKAEAEALAAIPSWDDIRDLRDGLLTASDKIIAWSTETGNAVPADWVTYRQNLRDITTTYGAPSGNTELVVMPSKPSWPSA